MTKNLSLKIGISGVRGIIGDSLTPQLAASFAQAFGTYTGKGKIIVGQDARLSGTMLKHAVFAGLLSIGCQPVDIGICPLPSTLVLAREKSFAGAIVVTASHNPPEWNGMKFISSKGLYLTPPQVEEFLDIYHQGDFSWIDAQEYKSPLKEMNPTRPHLKKLLGYLEVTAIQKKRFTVVADCSFGAGSKLLPDYLESLGCKVVFCQSPGDRPNASIRRNILKHRADVGFVQDADADRLAIYNEQGLPLGEELTLAIAVNYILSKKKGPVVINLSTSRAVEDIAQKYNVPLFRTKIGEINVVEEILQKKAVIGGEGNGGVIFPPVHPCRDSFTAIGLTLEAMSRWKKSVSQLQEDIPKYVMVKDQIEGSYEQAFTILRGLREKYGSSKNVSTSDGLKFDFENSWLQIRPSNTEPIIRIFAEAKTRGKALGQIAGLKKDIEGIIHGNHH